MRSNILRSAIVFLLLNNLNIRAQFSKGELVASGLTCSMCSFATQKQLKTLDFIDSIGADLDHTTFILYFKEGKIIDPDKIKKKVEDAGFSVASLRLTYHFDNLKIESDHHLQYQGNLYHFVDTKSQVLNGNVVLKVLDKGFVSDKEYKKYLKRVSTQANDRMDKIPEVTRVYHVTIVL